MAVFDSLRHFIVTEYGTQRGWEKTAKNEKHKKDKIYVRYDEGVEMYSIRKQSFMNLAVEAHAVIRFK